MQSQTCDLKFGHLDVLSYENQSERWSRFQGCGWQFQGVGSGKAATISSLEQHQMRKAFSCAFLLPPHSPEC